jgi:fibro-slime domain-containing protein
VFLRRPSPATLTALFVTSSLFGTLACSASGEQPVTGVSSGSGSTGSGSGSTGSGSTGAGSTGSGSTGAGSTGSGSGVIIEMPDGGNTCGAALPAVFRDFKGFGEPGGHTDFEISARNVIHEGEVYKGWNDVGCGLVEPNLGPNGKPIFYTGPADVAQGGPTIRSGVGKQKRVVAGAGCWPSTTGICNVGTCQPWDFNPPTYEIESSTSFDQWYTTSAINMEIAQDLPLTEMSPGVFVYDSNAFFPLDNQGFGNTPGQAHNYHFTTEIHVTFEYQAGQIFTFRGDDDLWIFVNKKLALDVGGLHEDLEGSINFDQKAAALGITPGNTYQMDIFHAERQTTESNFRVETNIKCFIPVPPVK